MTKVIYFVLPSSLMMTGLQQLGLKSAEFLPAVGPVVSYAKKAKKVP